MQEKRIKIGFKLAPLSIPDPFKSRNLGHPTRFPVDVSNKITSKLGTTED